MPVDKVTEIPKLIKDARQRQYLPSDELGSGGFATCWKARMVDRRDPPEAADCALKAIRAKVPANLCLRFRLELAIQSKLQHPNIVEMYRAFTFQDTTYVALELCPNGSLTDMVKKRKFLTMGEIRRILIQLCGAVKYLHQRDVVHRDIKAGNIFLDENMNVKLGDFGLAAIMEPGDASKHARRTTFCGTPNYLAPEILSRDGSGHGMSVDVWAIGVLAYYLAVGRAPFQSKSRDEIYQRLRKGDYSWPELSSEQNEIPEDLRSLVGSLLVKESKRPTLDQIVRHSFFRGFIPDRIDPLCRTRRPRWGNVDPGHDSTQIYEKLCQEAGVGVSPTTSSATSKTGKASRKQTPSLFVVLANELESGNTVEIPLPEGVVYTGRTARTQAGLSSIMPVIHEDSNLSSTSTASSSSASSRPTSKTTSQATSRASSRAATHNLPESQYLTASKPEPVRVAAKPPTEPGPFMVDIPRLVQPKSMMGPTPVSMPPAVPANRERPLKVAKTNQVSLKIQQYESKFQLQPQMPQMRAATAASELKPSSASQRLGAATMRSRPKSTELRVLQESSAGWNTGPGLMLPPSRRPAAATMRDNLGKPGARSINELYPEQLEPISGGALHGPSKRPRRAGVNYQ